VTRRFDLVAFDVDGTLVHHAEDKTVWEVLNHRFTGSDDQNTLRWDLYKQGKLSYAEWVALDIGSWRDAGATRDAIVASFGELKLVDGARETLHELKSRGVRLAVISGTLNLLLDVLFPDHPFDEVYTNRIAFDSLGRIEHWHADAVRHGREGRRAALDRAPGGHSARAVCLRGGSRERRGRGAPRRLFHRVQFEESGAVGDRERCRRVA
jgi:HAD superfamily phosphoserine phosphatase-like hydrolase